MSEQAVADRPAAVADPRDHDRFEIRQRFRPMVNQYEVSTLVPEGEEPDQPVCFVQQRRFKLKEEINAFTDDTRSSVVFTIKARQRWDPAGTYDIADDTGARIGQLKKIFGRSLLRSTWEINDAQGEKIGWAQESNMAIALVRRFVDFLALVPLVGWILAYLVDVIPIPYDFRFYLGEETPIGDLHRIWGIRDRYSLDLSADATRAVDRRVALALAVGMDALQAR
jgi:hypothetical protein